MRALQDEQPTTWPRRVVLVLAVVAAALFAWVAVSDLSGEVGWRQAALLGVVEGVTEYLPVSSTGHLAVATSLLWPDAAPERRAVLDSYVIVIQAGAIVAVFGLYWRRFVDMAVGMLRATGGRRLAVSLVAAFIPAAVAGLLLGGVIKDRLFGLVPIAWAWLVGGVAILVLERLFPDRSGLDLDEVQPRQGWVIGLAQVLALWPGTSRSLVTILGGRAVGLSTRAAVEFSFLLGAVTLLGASVYEGAGNLGAIVDDLGVAAATVGFVAATFAAAVSARWLVAYLSRRSLVVFGWYRIAVGIGTLLFLTG